MARFYTIDASVFLNAYKRDEAGHEESAHFLREVRLRGEIVAVPTLLLPEVTASIARGLNDSDIAVAFGNEIATAPGFVFASLDLALAKQACEVAADRRLRGGDAVYGAVARRFGSVLVTRDREQRVRLAAVVTVLTPAEALVEMRR